MTEKQFERAVAISNRINALSKVKDEIKDKSKKRLTYSYELSSGNYNLCPEYIMRKIGDLLDKHDLMIRDEIDQEIERLEKEIETL